MTKELTATQDPPEDDCFLVHRAFRLMDMIREDEPRVTTLEAALLRACHAALDVLDLVQIARGHHFEARIVEALDAVRIMCCRVLQHTFSEVPRTPALDVSRGPAEDAALVEDEEWSALDDAVRETLDVAFTVTGILRVQAAAFAQFPGFEAHLRQLTYDSEQWSEARTRELARALSACSHEMSRYSRLAGSHEPDDLPIPNTRGFFVKGWRAVRGAAQIGQKHPPTHRTQLGRSLAAYAFLVAATRIGFTGTKRSSYVDTLDEFLRAVRDNEFNPPVVAREALRALGWDPARFTASERQESAKKRPSKRSTTTRAQVPKPRAEREPPREEAPPTHRRRPRL